MPLAPGSRLGPYEVTSLLGAGGMGEVYRARDTKLNREVALKILRESLLSIPTAGTSFDGSGTPKSTMGGFHQRSGTCQVSRSTRPYHAVEYRPRIVAIYSVTTPYQPTPGEELPTRTAPPLVYDGGRDHRPTDSVVCMHMRIIKLAVASAVSTAIACGAANDPAHRDASQESQQAGPGITATPSINPVDQYAVSRKRILDQIENAQQLWRGLNIHDYRLTVQLYTAWSAPRYEMSFRNGRLTTGWASERWPNGRSMRYEMDITEGEALKVDGLLDRARAEVLRARVPTNVTIRFDPRYGYPEKTSSDDPAMFDDEATYEVTAFSILKPGAP